MPTVRRFARRLPATIVAAVAVVLVTAAPGRAHGFDAARLDSPFTGTVYEATPAAAGYFEHTDTGIAGVDLALVLLARTGPEEPPGQDPCAPPALASLDAGGQQQFTFQVALPELPCNGEYGVSASARSRPHLVTGSVTTATVSATFLLAAPPRPPDSLDARFDEAAREVTLGWEANTEVDLLGYLVERSIDDSDFLVIGDTNDAGFVDEVGDGGGAHTYRVRAVRRGPNSDIEAVASDPSNEDAVDVTTVETEDPDAPAGEDTSPTTSTPPPSREVDLSTFSRLQDQAQRPVQAAPRVTVDTGFQETLPFQVPPPTVPAEPAPTTTEAPDPADDLAVIDYEDGGGPDTEAVLVPAAGAMALLVGALQMRYLLKRASVAAEAVE